ncbi:MAG: hypothetical protein ACHQ4H_09950 [Ktedonobacterales bacterium]
MLTEQRAVPGAARRGARPWRAWLLSRGAFETALIVLTLLAHGLLLAHGVFGDGLRRYDELTALLAHGQISNDKYSLIGPIFSTPLWLLGHVYRDSKWWVARYNLLLFALALLAIYLLLKDRIDRRLIRTFLLLLAVASMFPVPLTSYYGETFTALLVGVGLLAAVFGPALIGWVAVVLGVANTAATLVALGFAAVTRVVQRRRLRYALAVVAAFAAIALENYIRHGSLSNTRYESGFTYPILFGLLSILFSFGKGLIFFAPGLLLPIRGWLRAGDENEHKLYQTYLLWVAFVAGMIVLYANWYDWSGDWFWGPRFFLIASLPASLALAVRLRRPSASLLANLVTFGVLCLAAWVGLNGVLFDLNAVAAACGTLSHLSPTCSYVPQTSALWYPFVALRLKPGGKKLLLYAGVCLIVFVYLAAPLVAVIARQAWTAGRAGAAAFLAEWRHPAA